MNRGDELRVASTINELRRGIDHHLRNNAHDGRFQAIERAIDGITTRLTDLQAAVSGIERAPTVGVSTQPPSGHEPLVRSLVPFQFRVRTSIQNQQVRLSCLLQRCPC